MDAGEAYLKMAENVEVEVKQFVGKEWKVEKDRRSVEIYGEQNDERIPFYLHLFNI